MAFENTISCVTDATAGTTSDIAHGLGVTPDLIILTPQAGSAATPQISGGAYLGSSTFANNSIVCIAANVGSFPLRMTAMKLHSIIT